MEFDPIKRDHLETIEIRLISRDYSRIYIASRIRAGRPRRMQTRLKMPPSRDTSLCRDAKTSNFASLQGSREFVMQLAQFSNSA
jgi:hypothetical protein